MAAERQRAYPEALCGIWCGRYSYERAFHFRRARSWSAMRHLVRVAGDVAGAGGAWAQATSKPWSRWRTAITAPVMPKRTLAPSNPAMNVGAIHSSSKAPP